MPERAGYILERMEIPTPSMWNYIKQLREEAKPERKAWIREHGIIGGVVVILAGIGFLIVSPLPIQQGLAAVGNQLLIDSFVVGCLLLVGYFIQLLVAAHRIHNRQLTTIEQSQNKIEELQQELEYNRPPTTDMDGWEVLEYMIEHSGLTEKRDIENVLRKWAIAGLLFVEAFYRGEPRPLPVPDNYFKKGFSFDLVPKDARLRECFGYFGQESYDSAICGVNDRSYVIYNRPRFRRAQIEALCKSWTEET